MSSFSVNHLPGLHNHSYYIKMFLDLFFFIFFTEGKNTHKKLNKIFGTCVYCHYYILYSKLVLETASQGMSWHITNARILCILTNPVFHPGFEKRCCWNSK